MKKHICLLLAFFMLLSLCACGGKQPENNKPEADAQAETGEWTRQGYYQDENGNILSVTLMEDVVDPGWYVGCMLGEDPIADSFGGMLDMEGNTLRGTLPSGDQKKEITVTVSEDGEEGLMLTVDGGETYHFVPMNMEVPYATLWVNTDGLGYFNCTEEGQEPDGSHTASLQYGLTGPETYTLTAEPEEGWHFVKWTLNGEDYSAEPQIIVEITEDSDFVAVFEFTAEEDGQNPVMNVIGPYASGRARAMVEADGMENARISIEWGASAWELAKWVMSGRFDPETMTVSYTDCVKSILVYKEDGSLESETIEYENGTGTIVFDGENSFTWKGDQSEQEDLVFEWSWESPEE